jgi:hypothetical protein
MNVRKNALCDFSAGDYNRLMYDYFVNHCYIGSNPKYKCFEITLIKRKAEKIVSYFDDYLDFDSIIINITGCCEYNEFHKSMSNLIAYQQIVYICQDYLNDHPNDFNCQEIQDQLVIFNTEMNNLTNYIFTNSK